MSHTQYIKHANMMQLHIVNQENNLFQRTISRNFCPGYQTKMRCWYFQKKTSKLKQLSILSIYLYKQLQTYIHAWQRGEMHPKTLIKCIHMDQWT